MLALLAGTLGPVYQVRIMIAPMADTYAEDRLVALMFCVVYVGAAILGARAPRRVDPLPLLTSAGLAGLLLLSTVWSPVPELTATQATLTALTLVLPWYLARRWSVEQVVTMAWAATALGVAASALAVLSDRALSVDAAGDWAGIYYNRNSLGPVAGLCLVLGIHEMLQRMTSLGGRLDIARRAFAAGSVALSAIMLLGCGSKASILSTAATLATWALVQVINRLVTPAARVAAVWSALGVSAILLVLLFRPVSRALGSDDTLQGRTELWGYLMGRVRDRPLTGDGWLATYTTDDYWYWGVEHLSRNVATAHNGIFEVAVGAGVVALAALLALLWMGFADAVGAACARRTATGGLVVAVYFFLANSAESFIGAHHLPWVLFLGCCAYRWTPSNRRSAVESDVPQPAGRSRP
ncbi:MAG: O-antigen ligase family protein [Microthrixaceae bacterium]